MTDLPQGWASVQVQDLFHSFSGGTPSKANPAYWGGKIPWFSSGDIKSTQVTKASESITQAGLDNSSARPCRPGSVLVVVRSGVLKHTLPVAILEREAAINQDLKCFDSGDDAINKWLALSLRASEKDVLALNREGTTVQSVKYETLKEHPLPIPPLAEQQRIVAKLEVLLGKVDACRKRLEKIPIILKRFRQSVLAAACSGRLTADWREENPDVESAEMLIDRISRERRSRHDTLRCTHGTGRKKDLADYDNFDPALRGDLELPDLPETWRWVDLRFLMSPEEAFCYGVVQPGEDDHGGPRLVRICDLGGGLVRISDLRGITAKVHGQYERSVISGGEVLISVVGTIGRAAIAPTELKGANIARAVAKIPIREFEARYFLLWLSTSRAETWMVGDAREVARKTLNLEQLRTLPVPLPPILEQQEIVSRVEALFALADLTETRCAKAKTHVDRLTQSILAKAFRGDLVSQDPNDEPAAALLERIREEQEGAGVVRWQRRRKGSAPVGNAG